MEIINSGVLFAVISPAEDFGGAGCGGAITTTVDLELSVGAATAEEDSVCCFSDLDWVTGARAAVVVLVTTGLDSTAVVFVVLLGLGVVVAGTTIGGPSSLVGAVLVRLANVVSTSTVEKIEINLAIGCGIKKS